jgi:hypothetical protein
MNYDNKTTLYEEAKKSLKKFKGNDTESSSIQTSIKLEQAFLAAKEEALLAMGYIQRSSYHGNYSGERGEIGSGENSKRILEGSLPLIIERRD